MARCVRVARALPLALFVALLALPLAAGGTEAEPEFKDAAGDAKEASLDVLAAWIEDAPGGVRFTIEVAGLPSAKPLRAYEFGFGYGLSQASVAVGFDTRGDLRSDIDTPSGWGAPGILANLDDALLDERFIPGSPAYLSATIPRERFGWSDGARIRAIVVRSIYYDDQARVWNTHADETFSDATFYVGGKGVFPIVVPLWMIPTIVVACVVGGAGGGYAFVRWRARAPPPAAPEPAPPIEPYRMRKAPK